MKMKFIYIILIIILLKSCGYQPMYSSKNIDFKIINLETEGDLKINQILKRKLLQLNKNNDTNKSLNINISSNVIKNISSKDKKGNATTFTMTLNINLNVIENEKNKKSISFTESTSYNNSDNKFELKKYETTLKNNLSEKIVEKIIEYLN